MSLFRKHRPGQIKLRFLGAAQNVTGSRHLLDANGTRILVDCGLYQERQFAGRNWEPLAVPPKSIDAVLLTHAHLDHCGYLPKLVKDGFKGRIYCTAATAEIAKIILLDAAHLQQEDAEFKRKRHERQGRKGPYPEVPLYTTADAEAVFPLFEPVKYRQVVPLGQGVEATFYDAGHVLGSAVIRVKVRRDDQHRIIIFSGDVGRPDRPIVCDPTVFEQADYVLVESTYGDRLHQPTKDIQAEIARIITETQQAGGNLIVPSFALERSQEVLYYVNELLLAEAIRPIVVFLDSPMAARITEVFKHHRELFDEDMTELVEDDESPFDFPGLNIVQTTRQSKAINSIRGTVMVIAGSGMCTGGRIKHHLANNISRPECTIMFVGYQAVGTLGRRIVEGEKQVRILGQTRDVRARIEQVHGFSAHADREELLAWLRKLKTPPRKVFVVHGEEQSALSFGRYIEEQTGWDVAVPAYEEEAVLD